MCVHPEGNQSTVSGSTPQRVCAQVNAAAYRPKSRDRWKPSRVSVSPKAWLCIFLLAAGCSALGYVLYNYAIRFVDPITVSLTININPIAACIGGALLLGETMTATQLLGGVLIIASMLVDTLDTSGALHKNKG